MRSKIESVLIKLEKIIRTCMLEQKQWYGKIPFQEKHLAFFLHLKRHCKFSLKQFF